MLPNFIVIGAAKAGTTSLHWYLAEHPQVFVTPAKDPSFFAYGVDAEGRVIVAVDPRYFRPTEVDCLLGDPTKAREQLGWAPRITFAELVTEMMQSDLALARRDALIVGAGYRAHSPQE